jgi:hypothetical protein
MRYLWFSSLNQKFTIIALLLTLNEKIFPSMKFPVRAGTFLMVDILMTLLVCNCALASSSRGDLGRFGFAAAWF